MASQVSRVSCGFCKNAGIFGRKAAHLVKECPVLAKTECRYCHKLGHTKNRCEVLKEKNKKFVSYGYRKPSYRRRASGRNLFDHVEHSFKAGAPSIREPVAKGKTLKKQSQNSFAVLEESDAVVKRVALPKVVEAEQPLKGAWANKLGSKKPVEEPVEQPTSAMPGTLAILESIISRQEAESEQCHEDVYDMRVALNRRAYEVFNQEPAPTYIGAWADACDSDDSDGEIEYDSMGRPSTDNSAW